MRANGNAPGLTQGPDLTQSQDSTNRITVGLENTVCTVRETFAVCGQTPVAFSSGDDDADFSAQPGGSFEIVAVEGLLQPEDACLLEGLCRCAALRIGPKAG